MNEFSQIKTFVALVESGSISKAAEKMDVAVSAVSRRLKELESSLGVQLIQRTTRKMHLTEVGERFYQRCGKLLDDFEEAKQEASNAATSLSGTLKIATPLSFGVAHLSPAIAAFMHLHPEVKIDLDMSDRRVDLVEEGIDLAIRIGTLEDSSLMARKLAVVRHVVCASPEFLTQYGTPNKPEDLAGMPALCYGNLSQPDIWYFRDQENNTGSIKVPLRMRSTNGDALVEAAVAGLGILCEPSFIVHGAVKRGVLTPVLTDYQWYAMNIYAVYPHTKHVPARVRAFIDFLASYFGDEPYWEQFLENGTVN
ncbi:LysR family transcriptional regulator [Neptuniibacter sp. QD29_5]|uniref:LysR family transcriptional regulator n=1 Tax=Neptuniibacter sp. QD29_5 TaxID=3398207 RepID=UPI0039F5755C